MTTPKTIWILNGANLNMLGLREPHIYGHKTLDEVAGECRNWASQNAYHLDFRQSNHEGILIDWVQEAYHAKINGLILNAGGYTHTSIALHDALKILPCPIIELHITNPKTREPFRHISFIEPLARAHITGKGTDGYVLALDKMAEILLTSTT